jgi:hypothetical protein
MIIISGAQAAPLDNLAIWHETKHSIGRCITQHNPGEATQLETYCTCALIARDAVITAQHCLREDFDAAAPGHKKVKIRLRLQGNEYGVIKIIARGEGAPGHRADWVTLRLTRPVPDGTPLPISMAPPNTGEQLAVVGFGSVDSDAPIAAKVRQLCKILEIAAAQIVHSCLMLPGDSGAPLLARDPRTGWRIIGVNYALGVQQPIKDLHILKNFAIPSSPAMLTGLAP